MNENVLNAVKEARASLKKRNFSQSFDLIVNLKLFDPKKSENKINAIFALPYGRGKDAEVAIFADGVKDAGCETYGSADIDKLSKDKRGLKKLSREVDFFLAEPKLMPVIGKSLGRVLAPIGKMPSIVVDDFKVVVIKHRKSVRIKIKDSPVIQCVVGVENMKDEEIAENVESVLAFLEKTLPKGKNNIGKTLVKATMGKPVKISQ